MQLIRKMSKGAVDDGDGDEMKVSQCRVWSVHTGGLIDFLGANLPFLVLFAVPSALTYSVPQLPPENSPAAIEVLLRTTF
jgi:hypothetical protein